MGLPRSAFLHAAMHSAHTSTEEDERLTEIALDVEVLRKGGFSAAEAVADCRLSMFKHWALSVGV